jgi:hypothetical protein
MILNKDVLVNNIVTELSDNSTGQISPYDIRHNLLDIIDSVHLLTKGKPLDGSNFGTPNTRNTRVGEDALSKIDLAGYFSIDNTALGYGSLKANYQGVKNTALGSHALFCNIYGENNVAAGYSSLGGNTIGFGNIGIGNFTLNNTKDGNFNIAIGHGAGYYVPNGTNNKLFIASHNIDSEYVCDNPLGSGLTPLVYGDLSSLKFGIAVNNLHSDGTLQVSGNITPAYDDYSNLGSSNYRYRYLYLSSGIYFDPNLYISKQNSSNIQVRGNLLPEVTNTYNLGSHDRMWSGGVFNNIYVSGVATINRFVAYENCNYFCKTINLASSGNISLDGGGPDTLYDYSGESSPLISECGYLPDQDLTGAGFNLHSSGVGYSRIYSFLFNPPDNSLSCLQQDTSYSRASWNSNISIHLESGRHLRSDRIIFPSSINIVNSSGCFGLFSRGSGLFFSKSELVSHNQHPSGYLAGVGDVNFYATSGDSSEYIINFAVPDSGITIKHRLLSGIKKKSLDNLNNNADKLNGFEFQYIDDANNYIFGPTSDRLIIGSYYNTSLPINTITLMKNNDDDGIVGITNLSPNSKNIIPATSLNIRSANNAIARLSAENQSSTISAIQLLGGNNCLEDGAELSYLNGSGLADLSIYKDSGKTVVARIYSNNTIGLYTSSGVANEMLTIGDSFYNDAVISMRTNPTSISSTTSYGKIYVKDKLRDLQAQSLYFLDGSGNIHDLVVNKFDVLDARGLYTDPSGNTFGGLYCPDKRTDLDSCARNTALGSGALFNITTGINNSIFGTNSASGLTSGSGNCVFGFNSATTITSGNANIIIGSNSFRNSHSSSSNNIIIGNDGVGNNISSSYRFMIGNGNITLLDGVLGPSNSSKYLSMPSGGKFLLNDNTNTDSLQLRANYIEVIDRGGNNYPDNTLSFRFIGNESSDLLLLNHSSTPMTNVAAYKSPNSPRPYAELNGDIKLRGAIRFSDFTSLESALFLNDISTLQSGVASNTASINNLFGSFVEGYVTANINAPANGNAPTTGILYLKNQNWTDAGSVTLVNRDTTSVIHSGAYVIALKVNNEFRPLWISASDTKCQCCR